ncbi:hypothetical protein [Arthrobacter globiformis]|nr:hypothetical protein [Arthrobacter globiformis]
MATNGQFYWPSVGISVAAYGQFFMAANSQPATMFVDDGHEVGFRVGI